MATPELPLGYLEGGRTYLDALERLGLSPAALFWAYDQAIGDFVLVLVADEYDLAGPLGLSKALFRAYNAEATPQAIDPFVVRLHSPHQPVVQELGKVLPPAAERQVHGVARRDLASMQIDSGGFSLISPWIYRFETNARSMSADDARRRWLRFERNVDRVAA